jgi:transcription initiation factor TFIIIB Brf1 subunit/transcription initiation factor TFIIB
VLTLKARKLWRCECGNEDQAQIVTASDGEVVCGKCGTVLGQVARVKEDSAEQVEGWDEDADLCRKILEERVSRKGWQF